MLTPATEPRADPNLVPSCSVSLCILSFESTMISGVLARPIRQQREHEEVGTIGGSSTAIRSCKISAPAASSFCRVGRAMYCYSPALRHHWLPRKETCPKHC